MKELMETAKYVLVLTGRKVQQVWVECIMKYIKENKNRQLKVCRNQLYP